MAVCSSTVLKTDKALDVVMVLSDCSSTVSLIIMTSVEVFHCVIRVYNSIMISLGQVYAENVMK